MPSQRIQNRLRQIGPALRVAFVCPGVVAEATWRQLGREADLPQPSGDLPVPGVESSYLGAEQLCVGIGKMIHLRGVRMLEADRALDLARAERRRRIERRDRLTKVLYREVGGLRRRIKAALGRDRGTQYLRFLDGETSRDPMTLQRQAGLLDYFLSDPEIAPPQPKLRGAFIYWDRIVMPIRTLAAELDEAIMDVYSADAGVTAALADQRQAIEEFDWIYQRGCRYLEALLDLVGLPSLAELVRPGVGWRGRPRKAERKDDYPDLVARALQSRELRGHRKSRQGLNELRRGDPKSVQGLVESQELGEKSRQGLHELQEADGKSEQAPHEPGQNCLTRSESTVKKKRKRLLLGTAHLPRPAILRKRQVEEKVLSWPLWPVRETASTWWRKLRRAA